MQSKHSTPTHVIASTLAFLLLFLITGCSRDTGDDTASSSAAVQIIDVTLGEAGVTSINGEATSPTDFASGMDAAVDPERRTVVVRISASDSCPVTELDALQQQLQSRGLVNMLYKSSSGEELSLIVPTAEQMQDLPPEHVTRLAVGSSGAVTLDGTRIESGATTEKIAERLAQDDHLVVVIDLDPQTTYEDFMQVFAGVKAAEAPRIHWEVHF